MNINKDLLKNVINVGNSINNNSDINFIVGKNLISGIVGNYIINDNGILTANSSWRASYNIYEVEPSTQYTLSWSNIDNVSVPQLEIGEYDSTGTFLGNNFTNKHSGDTSHSITLSSTTSYVIIAYRGDRMQKVQFEKGSKTTYQPYITPTINVNGEDIYNKNDTILATGKNANGNYIKFANGVLICWNLISLTDVSFTAWGNIYGTDVYNVTTFPVPFYDVTPPRITINNVDGNLAVWVTRAIANLTGITQISLARATTASNVNFGMTYIAIGRWK